MSKGIWLNRGKASISLGISKKGFETVCRNYMIRDNAGTLQWLIPFSQMLDGGELYRDDPSAIEVPQEGIELLWERDRKVQDKADARERRQQDKADRIARREQERIQRQQERIQRQQKLKPMEQVIDQLNQAKLAQIIAQTRFTQQKLLKRKQQMYDDWSQKFFMAFALSFGKFKNSLIQLRLNEQQIQTLNRSLQDAVSNLRQTLNQIRVQSQTITPQEDIDDGQG